MKTRILSIAVVIAVVAVAAVLVINAQRGSSSDGQAAGTQAAAAASPDSASTGSPAAGESPTVIAPASFSQDAYKGRPLVINFFGSWCRYCRLEASDLSRFARESSGAQVIGIASQDTEQNAKAFMNEFHLTFPLVVDDGRLAAQYGINGWPTTIFFGADGKETDRLVGASSFDQFTAALARAQ